jgi:gluconokinase
MSAQLSVTLPAAVIGVDIGTTSTKAVAWGTDGRSFGSHTAGYPLEEPSPGQAVQDPAKIVAAAEEAITVVAAEAKGQARIVGISFSAAMHSLIALDGDGAPLTPVITWADTRASVQADRLRSGQGGLDLHRRTGTPLHPMSPLPKLVWFHEQDPATCAQAQRWVGIKELVLDRLCGQMAVDHSVAAAMGLLNLDALEWDPEALSLAGISADKLAPLVDTTHVLELTRSAAQTLGLAEGTPVVVGSSDGPLANLGVGAVEPGVAACSIGTSGALRVMVEKPSVDPLGRVFCYPLTRDRWVVGGAINNGGVVLAWAGDALAPDLGEEPADALLAAAATVPAGAGGLLMLPYLLSERAPHWSSVPRGAYVGLTRGHGRGHLVRAALEGVCLQLALVLHSMEDAGNSIREVRATGGFARSDLWRQMLADVFGRSIGFPAGHEGSSFGAALLGMEALGLIGSIDVAVDLVGIEETIKPDVRSAATYRSLLPVFSSLYDALLPTYVTLRRLAPLLPLELPTLSPPPSPPPSR